MFWANMNDSQRQSLCDVIEHFRIPVIDTEKYERAQVCTGGVPVSEINPHNMESLILPGVHFVGEVLDVDGQCGGYMKLNKIFSNQLDEVLEIINTNLLGA